MRLVVLILIFICLYQWTLLNHTGWTFEQGVKDVLIGTAYLADSYAGDFDRSGCEDAGDWTCIEIN